MSESYVLTGSGPRGNQIAKNLIAVCSSLRGYVRQHSIRRNFVPMRIRQKSDPHKFESKKIKYQLSLWAASRQITH